MPRRCAGLLALALALLLAGCAKDKCKDLGPAIEIRLSADPELARQVKHLKVDVTGDITKHGEYLTRNELVDDGVTTFVIHPNTPRDLRVEVTVAIVATDADGHEVARADTTGVAEGNGCNFFSATLYRSSRDGVRDQGTPDRSPDGLLFADGPRQDRRGSDASCGPASTSCWDVWAQFTKTNWAYFTPQAFGQKAVLSQRTYALFDGTDDTHKLYPTSGCSDRAVTWHIERRRKDKHTSTLLVRGSSEIDCGLGQPQCTGEIQLNTARGWKIAQKVKCNIATDNNNHGITIDTWCDATIGEGKISWQSGSACGGCCACPDGAVVDIEVVVSDL